MFIITIAVMMIPGQVTMIPLFLLFNKLGWVGSPLPLIVPAFFGVPFYIFLLRQFFLGLPEYFNGRSKNRWCEGVSDLLANYASFGKTSSLAVALFQFMGSWTDFLGPLLIFNR